MNQPPAIILPELPPLPPQDLPQADWNNIAIAFQTLANETVNVPNFAPAQQLHIIANHLGQMTNGLNDLAAQVANLTNTVVNLTNTVNDLANIVNEANTMSPIRMHNTSASSNGVLRYPDGAPVNQLPHTKTDAVRLSGPQAAAAAAALGLDPLPENATALQKRRQFLDYIGVFI